MVFVNTVYLIPTRNCNLSCPHCDIKQKCINEDFDNFYKKLNNIECNNCILFGGEPLLLKENQLTKLFSTGKIRSMSSNLILLNKSKINLLKDYRIDVATSWNQNRFLNKETEQKWFDNVKKLLENNIYVTILITLTDDLINTKERYNRFFDVLALLSSLMDIDKYSLYFNGIRFEPYVQSNKKLIEEMDDLMVEIYRNKEFKFRNCLAEDYKDFGNIHNCNEIYTLDQHGSLIKSCPHKIKDTLIEECLSCKYSSVCKPCKKQKVCTFFEKLYLEVKNG